jgi:hypothetical protein
LSFSLWPIIVLAGAVEEKPVRSIDEEIARHLQEMAESGELSRIEGYGKPIPEDSGWNATPEALRMPFKILKNSGFHPPEIEMFHERARLVAAIRECDHDDIRKPLQKQLSELEQKIALRLEALKIHGSL